MTVTADEVMDDLAVDEVISKMRQEEANAQHVARISALANELVAEAEKEPLHMQALQRPKDIWTLDSMKRREPLTGDLYGNGEFLFTFMPLLNTGYASDRFALYDAYKNKEVGAYHRLLIGYAELVYYCMKGDGCTWPVRETLTDEQGNTLYEDDGVTPKSVPLPITLENVKKLDFDQLVDFLNAMSRATTGEVSTQPS